MSWRIVVVSSRAKLDYKLGHLVVRGEVSKRIHLSEISTLIIENTAVSLTAYLLSELDKKKIKVIFCDQQRNPYAELISYYGSHDTSLKLRQQVAWKKEVKDEVWTQIVIEKIRMQRNLLKKLGYEKEKLLSQYMLEVKNADETNREGHAAKVYFNELFGMDFSRSAENNINAALNYGYSIILSSFNREIVACGYMTQLGVHHDSMYNQFNLASDLMEPFRPLIDQIVFSLDHKHFEHEEKMELVNVLNESVYIDNKHQYVNNAIRIFCRSVFEALDESDISLMRFYRNEL